MISVTIRADRATSQDLDNLSGTATAVAHRALVPKTLKTGRQHSTAPTLTYGDSREKGRPWCLFDHSGCTHMIERKGATLPRPLGRTHRKKDPRYAAV